MNKPEKSRKVWDLILGQLKVHISAAGSQAIPAPVIFPSLFLPIQFTLPQLNVAVAVTW